MSNDLLHQFVVKHKSFELNCSECRPMCLYSIWYILHVNVYLYILNILYNVNWYILQYLYFSLFHYWGAYLFCWRYFVVLFLFKLSRENVGKNIPCLVSTNLLNVLRLNLIVIFFPQTEPVFGDQSSHPGCPTVPLWNQEEPFTWSVIHSF